MMSIIYLKNQSVSAILLTIILAGCGLQAPDLPESYEAQDVKTNMIYDIKQNIICESIKAIQDINGLPRNTDKPIPDNYSMQLQLTLSVTESSALTPTVSYNRTFPNGAESGVSIGQNFSLGLSPTLSSTATRTDTTYSYYNVGKITKPGANDQLCSHIDRRGSSFLLTSDLGVYRFLDQEVRASNFLSSSKPVGKKPDKIDVYSYDLKFAVVSGFGLNPTLKLVSVSGLGMPILNLNRTRTHELLLTFGPTSPDGFTPSVISFNQQQTTTLNSTLRSLSGQ